MELYCCTVLCHAQIPVRPKTMTYKESVYHDPLPLPEDADLAPRVDFALHTSGWPHLEHSSHVKAPRALPRQQPLYLLPYRAPVPGKQGAVTTERPDWHQGQHQPQLQIPGSSEPPRVWVCNLCLMKCSHTATLMCIINITCPGCVWEVNLSYQPVPPRARISEVSWFRMD